MKIKINKPNSIIRIVPVVIFIVFSMFFAESAIAQPPPPPGGGGTGTNNGGNQTGGNAPVGSGTLILFALAAAYGGKKVFNKNTKEEER